MKKHLLLILALLAFVLPARAATELLFNFTQNSNGSDQGTSFSNNANVTAVISNVSYGDTYNVTDYVSSLTNVSNAYYNSKGGLHLGPNGTVTVNLKNTYKVVKYEVMGPTPTQHSSVNTSATVTVNGHTYTGVNAAGSANWNRVQYEPTATENVSSFTIKAGSTNVYIKSIHIYLEAESDFTAPKFVPNGGRVKKGQTITVVNCEPSRLPQMDVTYGSNNVANHTGDFTFTFEETGTFDCWATAHSSTWSDYSETTEVSFEVYEDATPEKCAKPVFSPASGTFGAGKEITVTCSTPGATINVSDGENFDINLTSGQTFKLPTAEGEYYYIAVANATGYEASETADASYTVQWPTCEKPVFNPDGGTVAPGATVTVTCSTPGAEIMVYNAADDSDSYIITSGETFTLPTTQGTYTYKAYATADNYHSSEDATATYTVTAPVREEVAPVISFSHEDQKVFGSEDEIDVTLSLNSDVYPVPDVIYYTLDGFMAHNTLETGNPGATPAGHVLTVAVDPATLSGTVRIERSHREALNHRAVTINAYASNTAGSDVAAATYIFNDNGSAPQPQPETVATPVFAPASGASAEGSLDVTVTCATEGATITVTGAGEARTGNSPLTFTLTPGEYNLSATAAKEGMTTSEPATASFTVTQTQAQDSDHKADFNTFNNGVAYGSYATYNSTDGWSAINSCVLSGTNNTSDNNPYFQFLGTPEDFAICLNGKKSSAGKLTSPKFNGNIKSLKFNYGFPYSESKCKFTVNIIDGTNKVVKSEAVEITSLTQKQAYSKEITGIDYTGEFTIEIVNNCLSASTSNKDRVAIWNLTWFGNGEIVTDANAATVAVEVAPKAAASTTTTVKPSDLTAMQANKDFTTGNFKFKFTAIASKTTSDVTVNQDAIWTISTVDGSKITAISIPWSGKSGSRTIVHTPASTNASDGTLSGTSGNINWAGSATSVQTKFKQGKQLKLSSFIITTEAADPTVDTPEIALNDRAGDTTKPVTATISCSTDGADVHYSVKKDGVETVADEVYSAALTFTEAGSYELTAWATKDGMTASAKASESFTITLPVCQAPAFEPLTGAEAFNSLTVKLSCATEGAQIQYKVNNGEQKVYDDNTGIVLEGVGVYTITAWATKEGMTKSAEVTATYTVKAEPVEELFFVMDQNLWDVDGAYPETVVPFVYDRENGWYDLDIASIPATGWRQTAEGWFEINGGFRGNFYVRDGKANRKGLVFGAAGTVANTTYATRAAADGNQLVEPGVEYNMYIAGEGDTHKVFTTIGDDTNSKAFSAGTIRVTHTPGNKDAAKPMTLQILANSDQTTGVDSITAEDAASDADARFFNLQGVEVPADRLAPGIYIRQAGSKATKVLVK